MRDKENSDTWERVLDKGTEWGSGWVGGWGVGLRVGVGGWRVIRLLKLGTQIKLIVNEGDISIKERK